MPLPGSVLLPHALVPLFIFEPRFRAMLAQVLESDRMLCLAHCRPGIEEAREDADILDVAGIGLVRACVEHADGTSHLILQGVARVRLGAFEQSAPYRVARLEVIASIMAPAAEEGALRDRLMKALEQVPAGGGALPAPVRAAVGEGVSLDILSDMVAASLVVDPEVRQQLLEQASVASRTRLLLRLLRGGE